MKPNKQLITPDTHNVGNVFRLFRVIIEITIPAKENTGPNKITLIYLYGA